ncbi:MAG: Fe-S cluster assembly protein SufD, partial [Pseudomonadota bacterium]
MSALARKQDAAQALLARWPSAPDEAGWAAEARAAARDRFLAAGAPAPRDEYWRFTDPATLVQTDPPEAALLETDEIPVFDAFDVVRLVFVDGVFRPDLSDPLEMAGVTIDTLDSALATDIHWAREVFGVLEAAGQDPVVRPMAALNTAVAPTGAVIRATGKAAKPVALRYLHEDTGSDAAIRHVIKLD